MKKREFFTLVVILLLGFGIVICQNNKILNIPQQECPQADTSILENKIDGIQKSIDTDSALIYRLVEYSE